MLRGMIPVPDEIQNEWRRWRSELQAISCKHMPRCYFPKEIKVNSLQVHGFSDASEAAYAGVVYLQIVDMEGKAHTTLVISRPKRLPSRGCLSHAWNLVVQVSLLGLFSMSRTWSRCHCQMFLLVQTAQLSSTH